MEISKNFSFKSIKHEVLFSIMSVVLVSMLLVGMNQYITHYALSKEQLLDESNISLAPIVTLATRNVSGGNLMNLKNSGAQDLYETNQLLLYVSISGTSNGSEKTEYMEAIPPKPVEFTFLREGVNKSLVENLAKNGQSLLKDGSYFDMNNHLLLVKKELDIPNGGEVVAVFSAKELEDLWLDILTNESKPLIIILIGALFVAFYVGNRISKPIVSLSSQITEITKTLDLSKKVEVNTENEIHLVAVWFNSLVDNMKEIIGAVSGLTENLNQSVTEIAASIQEQAGIASEQSSSVSEITSTMEELSATSGQIAENSNSVVELAKAALHEAEKGSVALDSINEKMVHIENENRANLNEIISLGEKSKEIGKVMEIINSIADQSKLIAFNAAIEASSANEAGKRFSVVAVEIRRLADNVMESTKDIARKIDEIQSAISRLVITSEKSSNTIKEGADISKKTLAELLNIVAGAKDTTDAASQISLSSQQQKTATSQTLTALKEIESGARQSSISIKQTSSVTNDLTRQAEDLKEMMTKFKI